MDFITFGNRDKYRGTLCEAHISDLHFDAMDPQLQYDILNEQFITPLESLPLDLVVIEGDIFDHKGMNNSNMTFYSMKFVDELINRVIRPKQCTLIIIGGTYNHDANQLRLFYHYMNDKTIDVRIVETIKFEYVKNAKFLCIPELNGIEDEIYQEYLFNSGIYDGVFMHGTIKGAIAGDNAGNSRLFTMDDFALCAGPIISGHVHGGKNMYNHFYYIGSPYSWRFDDKDDKGFFITLRNLDTGMYYINKIRIESFRYETVNLDLMVASDPKSIIDYIQKVKEQKGIDFIRVIFTKEASVSTQQMLTSYYKNNKFVKLEYRYTREREIAEKRLADMEEMQQYSYLFDNSLSEYDILSRYINEDMGEIFITADELKSIIEQEF